MPSDSIQLVEGEGMPNYKNSFLKGNLLIKFKVEFPENHFADEKTLKVRNTLLILWEMGHEFILLFLGVGDAVACSSTLRNADRRSC